MCFEINVGKEKITKTPSPFCAGMDKRRVFQSDNFKISEMSEETFLL